MAEARAPAARADLAVFVHAGEHLFAIRAAQVERLVLADELGAAWPDGGGPIAIAGTWYAGVALLERFAAGAPGGAVVLARRADGLRLALQVGACVRVAPLPPVVAVPAALVRHGASAIAGAFPAGAIDPEGSAFGLLVDLDAAWSSAEAAALRQRLAAAEARR